MLEQTDLDSEDHCADSCGCHSELKPEFVPITKTQDDETSFKNDATLVPENPELKECKDKLMRTMADYENMMRHKDNEIVLRTALKIDSVMTDILQIHDDIERAHAAFVGSDADLSGLAGILKNTNTLLAKHNVTEINALGTHFDPEKHESIKVVDDDFLDDGTVTKVIRKGYICQNRILQPSLVEISGRSVK